jgi:F-box-like
MERCPWPLLKDPYDSHIDSDPTLPLDSRDESSCSVSPSYPFPFHRLPVELLVAIFQEFECSSRRYNPGSIPSPVILSHVCRLWRDVALDTATLWTDIRIYHPSMTQIRRSSYYETCLERSKSSLIDVNYYHFYRASYTIITVLSSLLPHIARVRRLTFVIENRLSLLTALQAFDEVTAAPRLESLRISLLDRSGGSFLERTGFPLFAGGAPLLRSVQYNGILFTEQPRFTGFTSFTFRMRVIDQRVYLPHFLDILTSVAHTLVRLRVWEVDFYSEPSDHPFRPVELPLLESLDLSKARILPYLHIPRLRRLYMKDVKDETLETFMKLSSSLGLSKLQSLKFDNLNLSCFKDRIAVVRGLPLLTELMIWNCTNDEAFLTLLQQRYPSGYPQTQSGPSTDSANPGVTMPHLRSLTVSVDISWPLVQAIIEGRITRGLPFDRIRFPKTKHIDSLQIEIWLVEKSFNYEFLHYDEEEIADLGDSGWISDEEHVVEEARRAHSSRSR